VLNLARLPRVVQVGSSAGEGVPVGDYGGELQGQQIGADFGLGQCLHTWDGSRLKRRVWLGGELIGITALAGIGWLASAHDPAIARQETSGAVGGFIIAAAIGMLLVMIPQRRRLRWLHQYEAGMAEVVGYQRQVSVVRWADLASMSLGVVEGEDGPWLSDCMLRDHAGNVVAMDRRFGDAAREMVIGRAKQVLAGRLAAPITGQLDVGLPVTIGCLTVDQSGIMCHGDRAAGGHWQVSWQQVRGVQTHLHGHRVTVQTDHRRGKRATLAGQPNDFLTEYMLKHAAHQVGVPFFAR